MMDYKKFWDNRYRNNPELGSGLGSRGANLTYKQQILREIISKLNPLSVLDIGCGDGQVTGSLTLPGYLGLDISSVAIELNQDRYPDKEYINADFLEANLPPYELTICFDLTININTFKKYRSFMQQVVRMTKRWGIISGYQNPPRFKSPMTHYYEPLGKTLATLGVKYVKPLGKYRDIFILFFAKSGFEQLEEILNPPLISTILLNWNRLYLLKKTLDSYLKTISVPYELLIIDNNSSDGSQEYIERFCACNANISSILLSQNKGGEALNLGLARASGQFLHVSENDLIYQENWDKKALKTFAIFPELGQLSLFSPFPPCDLVGETCRFYTSLKRNNNIIYPTDINIGSSSIFRREIWEQGVRWQNADAGSYRFPNDTVFSRSVIKLGYLVAWNDQYLVINQGHLLQEFKNNLHYYIENYRSKHGNLNIFEKRLNKLGYRLHKIASGYRISDQE